MVLAWDVGFDTAVYSMPSKAQPLLVQIPKTNILVAASKRIGFCQGRFAPMRDGTKEFFMNTTTQRLIIRRMTLSDLHDFLAYQNHPVCLQYSPIEADTVESATRFLTRQATAEVGQEGYFAFAVELAREGRMIGEVGIAFSPHKPQQGELGWSFHPDYHGQGYATEAAQALLRYAFEERELHRVTAACDTRNLASVRLMERLGMRREGHFIQSGFVKGTWQDSYSYALLRHEWLLRQSEHEENQARMTG